MYFCTDTAHAKNPGIAIYNTSPLCGTGVLDFIVYTSILVNYSKKERNNKGKMYLPQAARRASSIVFRRFATSTAEGKPPPVSF
jgi:hypothetical protein